MSALRWALEHPANAGRQWWVVRRWCMHQLRKRLLPHVPVRVTVGAGILVGPPRHPSICLTRYVRGGLVDLDAFAVYAALLGPGDVFLDVGGKYRPPFRVRGIPRPWGEACGLRARRALLAVAPAEPRGHWCPLAARDSASGRPTEVGWLGTGPRDAFPPRRWGWPWVGSRDYDGGRGDRTARAGPPVSGREGRR